MGEVFNTNQLEWIPIRPDIASGVFGKTLLADDIKLVLTRVIAGGRFNMHRDKYGHLFYFLSGEGLVWVEDKQLKIKPGLVVQITAGKLHAYENTGNQNLMLISVNLAVRQ
ncbi:MAG: cupin domain-containing protein [Dehalococcoidales bacterium]|nr:cupin domain-containing protein [Dehalococcoidales bacterium]